MMKERIAMLNLYPPSADTFIWATGIENTFIPQARPGLRALEEYQLTQHDKQWKNDIDLAAATGIKALRWGIPWYQVQPSPDSWDWRWTDEVLEYMVCVKGITPILDLMHYGTPLWLSNSFINARYPQMVAEYVTEAVKRYKSLVKYYTPLNEPMVNTEFCGKNGDWPPYLEGDDGYVKVLLALAKGMVLTTQAIKAEQPDAITVQVEALWHTWTRVESLRPRVELNNAKQWLAFDLSTGRVGEDYALIDFLRDNGMTHADLMWFEKNAVSYDVFGANFYPWSYTELGLQADGTPRRFASITHGGKITKVLEEAYARYNMPMVVTETSSKGDVQRRARWMDQTLEAIRDLRSGGTPVIGYTWFPMMTMIDWAYRRGRRPLSDYLLHLGLYDSDFNAEGVLQRRETALVAHFRNHMTALMPPITERTEALITA